MNEKEKNIVLLRLNILVKKKSRLNPLGFREFIDSWQEFFNNFGNIHSIYTLIKIIDNCELDTILDLFSELEGL